MRWWFLLAALDAATRASTPLPIATDAKNNYTFSQNAGKPRLDIRDERKCGVESAARGSTSVVGAVAPAAEEFSANLKAMIEATQWLTDDCEQPAHWVVHGESDLDDLKHDAYKSGNKKVGEARFRNTSVIIKRRNDRKWSPSHKRTHEAFSELAFLEYCRGGPGIPRLLGGYREGGHAVWVVEKMGEAIGSCQNHPCRRREVQSGESSQRLVATVHPDTREPPKRSENPKWDAFVEAAPLDGARAIFRCFQSFSEIGGFFLDDFHAGQFTFYEGALYLIEGPLFAGGPARDFVDGASYAGKYPLKRPDLCAAKSSGRPHPKNFTNEKCGRSANKRHVRDVAQKPYLLPFVIDQSAGDDRAKLEALSAEMMRPDPDARPSFAELLAALGPRAGTSARAAADRP